MKTANKEEHWVNIIYTIHNMAALLGYTQKQINDLETDLDNRLDLSLIRYLLANIYDIEDALFNNED